MRIHHAALYVNDLEKAKEFFCRYLGGTAGSRYQNEKTGFVSYFLTFQGETRLEIMYRPELADDLRPAVRTGYAHLAFSLDSRAAVDSLTETLRRDGYQVLSGPRITGDGYYESCVMDGEGNLIELTE